jgi:hypothetical protein
LPENFTGIGLKNRRIFMKRLIVGITDTGKTLLLAKEIESILNSYKSIQKKALVIDCGHGFEKFKNEKGVLCVEPRSLTEIANIEISDDFNLIIIDFFKLMRRTEDRINADAEIFKLINHNLFSKILIDETHYAFSKENLVKLINNANRYDLTFTLQDIEIIREIHIDEIINLNEHVVGEQ